MTSRKNIRDTLKSERAKIIYDELMADLAKRVVDTEKDRVPGGEWAEKQLVALEYRKFEVEQVRQIVVTVAMIDLEELKLLASASIAVASINK